MGERADITRVAVVGGGKMGEAIIAGWIAASEGCARSLRAENFVVANPGLSRRQHLHARYGVACVEDACQITAADVVVLAVKPQVMMGVIEKMAAHPAFCGGQEGPLFISIAAGLDTRRLEEALPARARLVRAMPNMALMVGQGATTLAAGSHVKPGDVDVARELFACLGLACVVEEEAMDATSAISGSGPAYVAAMIEALTSAGVKQGLERSLAESLALQTVYGTALLALQTSQPIDEIRTSICSPGGTTLAALDAMERAGLAQAYDAGVAAAVRRSKELASC